MARILKFDLGKGKGIKFEHYDMPAMKREGDIHMGGAQKGPP